MNPSDDLTPQEGGDFPEVEVPFEGTMEEEILRIVIEALNKQGYAGLDVESLRSNPDHRNAAVDMLRDCRPLPVVRTLIEKIENGRV